MMQFAHPLALLALVSIPIIIVLHVLRPRRQTQTVSSTSLWSAALRERQRGLGLQKLFRNISLLLLVLAALVASLALAGPHWLTQSNEHLEVVLVLDVSASMAARSGSGTRLDEAKSIGRDLLDGLPQGARALIMTTARKAVLRSGFETSKPLLRRTLASIDGTDEAGKPGDALALAASLLRGRDEGQIYFITDAAFDADMGMRAERVRLRVVGQGNERSPRNVAITRFDFRAEPGREDRFQVLLSVHNYTDVAVTVPATVTLERRTLFARSLEVGAGSTRTLVMPFAGKALGRATASIDIEDDLPSDNRAYAVSNVTEKSHILLFTAGNFYLQSVLSALPDVQVHIGREDRLANIEREARSHDVIIFDGIQPPALPAGNFLLLDTLPPDLPFQATGTVFKPRIQGTGTSALMQGVDLTAVRIDAALNIPHQRTSAATQRLFWSADHDLALALLDERKRMVILGFDINRSNFALQAAFPLFITRALEWLHPQGLDAAHTQIRAGEPYAIQVSAAHSELIMRTPQGDGQAYALDKGTLVYESTSTTGIYRYSIDNVVRYFAVNLTNAAESDIRPRSSAGFTAAGTGVDTAQSAAGTTAQLTDKAGSGDDESARVSEALWPLLTVLLLALLLSEWLLWCSGRRHA